MLNLFQTKKNTSTTATLPNRRVYAVGDVHGREDLLSTLLNHIQHDIETGRKPSTIDLIFLGDYIDRGHNSRGVLDLLTEIALPHTTITILRGNHEQILLDLLASANPDLCTKWLSYGGFETLASYGVPSRTLYSSDASTIQSLLMQVMPPAHEALLHQAPLSIQIGDYFFAHAGVRPGTPLDQQDPSDLLWIREPFLSSPQNFGAVVVHGHSITNRVTNVPNRIGIDTGAYATGVLTAVVLEEEERRFLSTSPTY